MSARIDDGLTVHQRFYKKHKGRRNTEYRDYYHGSGESEKLRSRAKNRLIRGLPEPTRPEPDVCELCSRPSKNSSLCLDHDHDTGEFRGWLCIKCNTSIAWFGDNEAGILKVLEYLKEQLSHG